jgi:hypothetical protein
VVSHLEPGKNEKESSPLFSPPPSPQWANVKGKKKQGTLSTCLGLSHWLHEIFSSQKSSSSFLAWANTPLLAKNTLPIDISVISNLKIL